MARRKTAERVKAAAEAEKDGGKERTKWKEKRTTHKSDLATASRRRRQLFDLMSVMCLNHTEVADFIEDILSK